MEPVWRPARNASIDEIDTEDFEEGDRLSCPECGKHLVLSRQRRGRVSLTMMTTTTSTTTTRTKSKKEEDDDDEDDDEEKTRNSTSEHSH